MSDLDNTLNQIISEHDTANVAAANICGLIQSFVRETIDYVVQLEEQRKEWLIDGNDGALRKFYSYTKDKVFDLAGMTYFVFEQLKSVSKETSAKLFSQFPDEMTDYEDCVAVLSYCFMTMSSEANYRALKRKIVGMRKLEQALLHHYAAAQQQ